MTIFGFLASKACDVNAVGPPSSPQILSYPSHHLGFEVLARAPISLTTKARVK